MNESKQAKRDIAEFKASAVKLGGGVEAPDGADRAGVGGPQGYQVGQGAAVPRHAAVGQSGVGECQAPPRGTEAAAPRGVDPE